MAIDTSLATPAGYSRPKAMFRNQRTVNPLMVPARYKFSALLKAVLGPLSHDAEVDPVAG